MTGWRVGWMVVPASLTDDLAKLIEYNSSCVFDPVQRRRRRPWNTARPRWRRCARNWREPARC